MFDVCVGVRLKWMLNVLEMHWTLISIAVPCESTNKPRV